MAVYKVGEFAKLANVTERTIRYYDKIGLLKPSFVLDNGYRQYSDKDLLKLQKIISLKHLGFSIMEIFPMVLDECDVKDSFRLQVDLIDSKIKHMKLIKDAMNSIISNLDSKKIDWNKICSLIQMINDDSLIVENYKNARNLNVRISIHDRYSQKKEDWFSWVFQQFDFNNVYRLLEVGCGNGRLWKQNTIDLRNREFFLSDISSGMVEYVRNSLGEDFNCLTFDCQRIPFKSNYFDMVIANHVLFYAQNIEQALGEIRRVLREGGRLYASTYGKNHMKEIDQLAKNFDSRIQLSSAKLYDLFGLENGAYILKKHFNKVKMKQYNDFLIINESAPIIEYIMSCHGNQNEILGPHIDEFRIYLDSILKEKGFFQITKQAGLFICE